jgi:plasmid stabilization system protein ParE
MIGCGKSVRNKPADARPLRPDIASTARAPGEPLYLILYRSIPDSVQIVRVLRGARHAGSAVFAAGLE